MVEKMFKLRQDIGVDLGTATVLIYIKGKGIVLKEPSVAAVDKFTGKLFAVGGRRSRRAGADLFFYRSRKAQGSGQSVVSPVCNGTGPYGNNGAAGKGPADR